MTEKTRKPLNREALARRREDRFLRRQQQIQGDVNLDPRLRRLLLDRTLWGVKQQIQFLQVDAPRISVLRKNRRFYRAGHSSFPSVLPDMDAPMGEGDVRPRPGIEAGRLIEWALDDHRMVWDADTGTLVINPHWRAGRKKKVQTGPSFKPRGKVVGDGRRAMRGVRRKNVTNG